MSAYDEWLAQLLRDHRLRQGHRQRFSGCWACDTLDVDEAERHRCRELSAGRVDGHHVVPKQTLKREVPAGVLEAVLWDPRNGVPLRRWHHDQLENRQLRVPRAALPTEVEVFAMAAGVSWWLDRTYGVMV